MTSTILVIAFAAGFLLIFAVNLVMVDVGRVRREQARQRLEEEMSLRQKDRARRSLAYKDLYELASEGLAEIQIKRSLRERFVGMVEESGLAMKPGQLATLSLMIGLLVGLVGGFLLGRWEFALGLAPVGAALPIAWVFVVRNNRSNKLRSQLPDAFDLMSRTMRAGQTISQALQSVAEEFSAPISAEFGYCYDQQNLGLSPEAAMRDLARRTGLLELKIFVLAVMVHRTTGGNLADLLEKIASVIRERARIQGAIKALTAEGRLQGAILMCLPPAMLVMLLFVNRPYMMTIFEYPWLLIGMFISIGIGGLWINRIVSFDF
jgi:tight adherence protein B